MFSVKGVLRGITGSTFCTNALPSIPKRGGLICSLFSAVRITLSPNDLAIVASSTAPTGMSSTAFIESPGCMSNFCSILAVSSTTPNALPPYLTAPATGGIGANISPTNLPPLPSSNLFPNSVPSSCLFVQPCTFSVFHSVVSLFPSSLRKLSHLLPLSAVIAPPTPRPNRSMSPPKPTIPSTIPTGNAISSEYACLSLFANSCCFSSI